MPGLSGTIQSSGYPAQYEPNSDCTYSLASTANDFVKVSELLKYNNREIFET